MRSKPLTTCMLIMGLACGAGARVGAAAIPIAFDSAVTDYQPVLSNAIAQAAVGDVIVLGEGVFPVNATVKVDKQVSLRGALNGGTVIKAVSASDLYPVVSVSAGATLDHLAVTGGKMTSGWGATGMGVQLAQGTLSYCVITNNIYIAEGNAQGSGVYVNVPANQTTTITHCRIVDNTGTASMNSMPGVGVYVTGGGSSHFRMDNCLIADNKADKGALNDVWIGGGLFVNTPDAVIANCTIVDNFHINRGGGIGIGGNTPVIKNCIIANNRANNDPCVYGPDVSASTLSSGYIAASITNGCLNNLVSFGGVAFGVNGLAADPNFVTDTYYLKNGSPAIGRGVAVEGVTDGLDLDGVSRDPASVDLGCFAYVPSTEFSMNVELGATTGFNDQPIPVTVSRFNEPAGKTLVNHYYVTDGANDYPVECENGRIVILRPGTWNVKVTVTADGETLASETSPMSIKIGVHRAYVTSNPNAAPVFPYATAATAAICLNDITALCIDGTEIELDDGTHTVTNTCSFYDGTRVYGQGRDRTWINGNGPAIKKSALYVDNANFLLENLAVTNYMRVRGGAVYIGANGGTIRNCTFAHNWLRDALYNGNVEGMTIESTGDNALIESCVFEHIRYDRNDNLCAGIAIRLTKGRARNCLFRDITADDGRVYDYIVYLGGGAVLDNCTFTDCKVKHVAGRSDAAFVYSIYGNGDVRNCIVCIPKPVNPEDPLPLSVPIGNFNASKVRNCCCEGETTIGLNPADGTKINFGRGVPFDLSSTSSCRDAGMVCDWMTGSSKDLLGRPRLYGRAPDIGCCETRARPALVIQVY